MALPISKGASVKPTNVGTGRVVGRFIVDVVDGADEDDEPDFIAASGVIEFLASVKHLPNPTAEPSPVTILRVPITGILDSEGYLCTPDPADPRKAGRRGVRLVANNDPDLLVQNWTWNVRYRFEQVNGVVPEIDSHDIDLGEGEVKDLTTAVGVPSSPGYGLPQSEAAVIRAETAATEAREDADAALAIKAKADAGEFNGDTLTMGITTTLPAGSNSTATISGTSPNKVLNLGLAMGEPGREGGTAVRVDNRAGRAIYMWDETANREQLIYGDTGERNILSDAVAAPGKGVKVTGARIRRVGHTVEINLGLTKTGEESSLNTRIFEYGKIPGGFNFGDGTLDSAWTAVGYSGEPGPSYVISGGGGRQLSVTLTGSGSYIVNITYTTSQPWPTSLPGAAIGTIPHL